MTKIAIALLSLTALLACAAVSSASSSGATVPLEGQVVQMEGVLPLSRAMVKVVNNGGVLTVSSPSFPSGYYVVYRFVSSRGNVVQAFSLMKGNRLQGLGKALPVQVKARGVLDEDVSWKLEREVVAMFSYGKSHMPYSEEILIREAVYGPLAGSLISRGGSGGFYGGHTRWGNGFASNHLKPNLPDKGYGSRPSGGKDSSLSPDKKTGGGTEQAGDEALADSGKEEFSLDSLLKGDVLKAPSPDPKTLRMAKSPDVGAVPEPSSALLGVVGISCLLMMRRRRN